MAKEKIYCGSGYERSFENGGKIVNLSVCLDDIPAEHRTKGKNGKTYVKLNLGERKQTGEYGQTHWVAVDTYKKNEDNASQKEMPF